MRQCILIEQWEVETMMEISSYEFSELLDMKDWSKIPKPFTYRGKAFWILEDFLDWNDARRDQFDT